MSVLATAGSAAWEVARFFTEAGAEPGAAEQAPFQINLFWIITQAATFLLLVVILYLVAFKRIGGVLEERRTRIEQGLKDADAARVDRETATTQRQEILAEARREAADILARSQRMAQEEREQGIAETRAEIERVREQAVSEIDAERQRALADVRAQVADLALLAASKVVGETLTSQRERRLVEEFLTEVSAVPPTGNTRQ